MLRSIVAAILLVLIFVIPAFAEEPQDASRFGPGTQWYQSSFGSSFSKPTSYIAGRLVCAVNVNLALAKRGIQGTGSRLAKSFLHWGRPSGPVPGAVAVYDRGGIHGHVAIVSRVEGSKVYVLNPGRHGWQEGVYHKRAIAYRIAS